MLFIHILQDWFNAMGKLISYSDIADKIWPKLTGTQPDWNHLIRNVLYNTPFNRIPIYYSFNISKPRWNGHPFVDDIFKFILLNDSWYICYSNSTENCTQGLNKKWSALVQIMAWSPPGDKILTDDDLVYWHIYGSPSLNELKTIQSGDTIFIIYSAVCVK